jgi:hypothetical protein
MVVTSRVLYTLTRRHTQRVILNPSRTSSSCPHTHVPKNDLSRFERLRIMQQYVQVIASWWNILKYSNIRFSNFAAHYPKLTLNLTDADSVAPPSSNGSLLSAYPR